MLLPHGALHTLNMPQGDISCRDLKETSSCKKTVRTLRNSGISFYKHMCSKCLINIYTNQLFLDVA